MVLTIMQAAMSTPLLTKLSIKEICQGRPVHLNAKAYSVIAARQMMEKISLVLYDLKNALRTKIKSIVITGEFVFAVYVLPWFQ